MRGDQRKLYVIILIKINQLKNFRLIGQENFNHYPLLIEAKPPLDVETLGWK